MTYRTKYSVGHKVIHNKKFKVIRVVSFVCDHTNVPDIKYTFDDGSEANERETILPANFYTKEELEIGVRR